MRGPGFLKQNTTPPEPQVVVVATTEQDGAVTGSLDPNSQDTQVIQASAASGIGGAAVAFPPGSLAIATDVTLAPGADLGSDATLASLDLADAGIAAAAPSVSVTSSVAMDTQQPFVLSLPLPATAGLNLQDAYENLVVIYKVDKVGAQDGYTGIHTRGQLEIDGATVRVLSNHFGTFQAVITKKKVEAPVEKSNTVIAQEQAAQEAEKAATRRRAVYWIKGFATTTHGDDQPSGDGLKGGLFPRLTRKTIEEDVP